MIRTNVFLFIIIITLVAIGVIMVFSTSGIYAQQTHQDHLYFLKRQLLWAALGLAALLITMRFEYGTFRAWSKPMLFLSAGLLVLVLCPQFGRLAGGARRWLSWKSLSFQPGEFAKLAMVLYLADFCSRKKKKLQKFSIPVLLPFILSALFFLLLIKQPDFGTGLVIILLTGGILFLAGMRIKYLLTALLLILPLIFILIFSVGYRRQRFLSFINPGAENSAVSYQTKQSLIALGSGGWKGLGLGKGLQKLFYLPGAQTDFIFSIIGEEAGFIGAGFVLLLYLGMAISIFRIALVAPDNFGYLLSLGVGILLLLQVAINLGVVTGLLPTKGTPLPFVSLGGSALFCNLVAIGMVLSVAKQGVR